MERIAIHLAGFGGERKDVQPDSLSMSWVGIDCDTFVYSMMDKFRLHCFVGLLNLNSNLLRACRIIDNVFRMLVYSWLSESMLLSTLLPCTSWADMQRNLKPAKSILVCD
jgi:hypothetical protein